ncbi:MAG: hypothetical protein ABSE52_04295 [Candidatus Dormibacteria bacterium]
MGQGVAEAERERELSKQALAGDVSALGTRVRAELDWRSRLRRDGFRYAVIGTIAVLVTVSVVLRSRGRGKESEPVTVTSLEDVAAQLDEIKKELARRRRDSEPLWQKLAVRAGTTAAAAAGAAVARQAMERLAGSDEPANGTAPRPQA